MIPVETARHRDASPLNSAEGLLPAEFPDDLDPEALARGVRLGEAEGLGRAAFLVRVADLNGVFDGPRRAAFWIGAVVGDDCEDLATGPLAEDIPVWVGGREPQRTLYTGQLRSLRGGRTTPLDDDLASARGALAVAALAGWLGQSIGGGSRPMKTGSRED